MGLSNVGVYVCLQTKYRKPCMLVCQHMCDFILSHEMQQVFESNTNNQKSKNKNKNKLENI